MPAGGTPTSPELAAVYAAAAWEPMGTAYAEFPHGRVRNIAAVIARARETC
ncbi:MAG: hypothetical protein JO063_11255 [Pseudonocardiales bacterium]|nr:hypothetical protein [Pseudonocardiales bacterium]MBW0010674.1 hypothetical protein [Pseudonocardiales bacterium]